MESELKEVLKSTYVCESLVEAIRSMCKTGSDIADIENVVDVCWTKINVLCYDINALAYRNKTIAKGSGKTAEAMRLDSLLEEGGGGLHG